MLWLRPYSYCLRLFAVAAFPMSAALGQVSEGLPRRTRASLNSTALTGATVTVRPDVGLKVSTRIQAHCQRDFSHVLWVSWQFENWPNRRLLARINVILSNGDTYSQFVYGAQGSVSFQLQLPEGGQAVVTAAYANRLAQTSATTAQPEDSGCCYWYQQIPYLPSGIRTGCSQC